jgi:hypothetical protein
MSQADNTAAIAMPAGSSRRRFLSHAAGVAAGGAVLALATSPPAAAVVAPTGALACAEADPIFALIARHRAEELAYGRALMAVAELYEIGPEESLRAPRVQFGCFRLHSHEQIDDRLDWMPDFASTPKIRAELHAELDRDMAELQTKRGELGMKEADDLVQRLCDACFELEWALANTMPTSVAGIAALLRYANECEDQGEEWPSTDTLGPDGWHYRLRQTAARALEGLLGDDRA